MNQAANPSLCLHRLLLNCARETYAVGTTPSDPPYAFEPPYLPMQGEPEVYEDGTIDLATLRETGESAILAFRGTLPPQAGADSETLRAITYDWLNDADADLVALPGGKPGVLGHDGFMKSLNNLLGSKHGAISLAGRLQQLRDAGKKLVITGHSKGGALAYLAAWRLVNDPACAWDPAMIRIATFAAARSGNKSYAHYFQASFTDATRYEITEDVVPDLPPGPGGDYDDHVVRMFAPAALVDAVERNLGYVPVGKPVTGSFSVANFIATNISHAVDKAEDLLEGLITRIFHGALTTHATGRDDHIELLLAHAHSIAPNSEYDRLVCKGGAGCTHPLP